jgi:hypothetical protein
MILAIQLWLRGIITEIRNRTAADKGVSNHLGL